jgi:hypothetical protein
MAAASNSDIHTVICLCVFWCEVLSPSLPTILLRARILVERGPTGSETSTDAFLSQPWLEETKSIPALSLHPTLWCYYLSHLLKQYLTILRTRERKSPFGHSQFHGSQRTLVYKGKARGMFSDSLLLNCVAKSSVMEIMRYQSTNEIIWEKYKHGETWDDISFKKLHELTPWIMPHGGTQWVPVPCDVI